MKNRKTPVPAVVLASALLFSLALPAQGAALVHIEGTLVSFTNEHYLISRNHAVYYIKRDALSEQQRKGLKTTGDKVEVVVPPSAIELVKDEKKSDS
jgi:hypothetical protein